MIIKIGYIIDNPNWSDGQFEDAQDNDLEFELTEDMIRDLILQNSNLERGDFITEIFINRV